MSTNEIKSMKSLRERAKEFSVLLPLMEGKEKGELDSLLGQVSTINDYGFLSDREKGGEAYVVFTVKERPGKFFFGGTVLTDRLSQLEAEGYHDAIISEGLPVLMKTQKNKKGDKRYTNVEFFPE